MFELSPSSSNLLDRSSLDRHAAQDAARADQAPPSAMWRMLASGTGKQKLPKGLDAAWDRGAGYLRRRMLRRHKFLKRAGDILSTQPRFTAMSRPALLEVAEHMRDKFRLGRETPGDLNEAFGLIRELIFRQFELRLHRVQIASALAIHFGSVAELATGEGKTLAATLPAIVAGWRGRGCHVITVNDYLARRDADDMRPIYRACGLSVSHVDGRMSAPERRRAYLADVTYVTHKEVAADFLRDRLQLGESSNLAPALVRKRLQDVDQRAAQLDALVLRGLQVAIIDEVDSVLIDEAVTPLIIAGEAPNREQMQAYRQAAEFAGQFRPDVHFTIDARYREIQLTHAGRLHLYELVRGLGGLWAAPRRREELMVQALVAREFFLRGEQYVVKDDKVVIIDETTGRLQPDRSWREEELELSTPKDTLARVSFQRFFRLYRQLGGMTGTAEEAQAELWQIYHLATVGIPTHRPVARRRWPDRVFVSADAKWRALLEHVRDVNRTGRPILVGTRSVESSQRFAEMLEAAGLSCHVLNAVHHQQEAQRIREAGEKGRITVATNMAGRGTDIKLGVGVRDLGGLHVVAAERNESGRLDRQLFGRAGRQGDPGSAVAFVSLDDELIRRYGSRLAAMTLKARGDACGELPPRYARLFDTAQRRAESLALGKRKSVLKNDDWLDDALGFAGRAP